MTSTPVNVFGRAIAIVLFIGIMLAAPCAFWTFAVHRVIVNPQTYKSALSSGNVYSNLLPALVEAIAFDTHNNNNPAVKNSLKVLSNSMSEADWAEVSSKLLPASWLQDEVDRNIDRTFDWLSGLRPIPDLQMDLTPLKDKLSSPDVRNGLTILVSKLPTCNSSQTDTIRTIDLTQPNAIMNLPLCNPEAQDVQATYLNKLTTVLNLIGQQMPVHLDLNEELRKDPTNTAQNIQADSDRIRAGITLVSRMTMLLFLVPLALLSLIVILTIRSSRGFFRWLGWGLVISGLITLIPVPFITAPLLAMTAPGTNTSTNLLQTLLAGMIGTVSTMLTNMLLIEVGVVVLVGFFALVVSVLIAPPPGIEPAPQVLATPPAAGNLT